MAAISFSSAATLSSNIFGLREWGKAMLCLAGAFLGLSLRGHAHPAFTLLAANLLTIAGPWFLFEAYSKFFGLSFKAYPLRAALFGGGALVSAAYALDWPLTYVVGGVTAPFCLALAYTSVIISRHASFRGQPSSWLSFGSCSLLGLAMALRMARLLFSDSSSSTALYAASGSQLILFLAGSLAIISGSLGFLLMAHDKQKKDILESSRRDGLTGLYTRSAFMESAAVLDRPNAQEPYSVVMVDIDFFKKINDSYGHASGDVAIIHTARLIAKSVRSTDIAARYGGEEFCVLLRGCGPDDAQAFANRLVSEARAQSVRIPNGENIRFTISAGFVSRTAGLSQESAGVKQLLDIADQALYKAKHAGRNQAIGGELPGR